MSVTNLRPDLDHWAERVDLAAAFRWTYRMDMHEAVANHFSLSISDDGTRFLVNPNKIHFARVNASDMIVVDANDPSTLEGPNAPDPTAWGLHGSLHREVPHARCAMHVHSTYATVLACLKDAELPAIDQNSAIFYKRQIIDRDYGGLAFEDEGARCAAMFTDPRKKVMVMGNHGLMVIGKTVAETFDRLFYFERAASTYIRALQTGLPLNYLSDAVAERTASQLETYPGASDQHLSELKLILDAEGDPYAT